eukprot:1111187-Amphidinium_carterae.1
MGYPLFKRVKRPAALFTSKMPFPNSAYWFRMPCVWVYVMQASNVPLSSKAPRTAEEDQQFSHAVSTT